MAGPKLVVNLSAGTAQYVADIEAATAANKRLGSSLHSSVSDVQATSASLRTLEGGFTNNLRAAERFIASFDVLRKATQAAFPFAGGIAVAGVLYELYENASKAYEGFEQLQIAPQRVSHEFLQLNNSLAASNDALEVTNARLSDDIAKLSGRPANGLAVALAEARKGADDLALSLEKDLSNLQKLLKEESVGAIKGFFTGQASSTELETTLFGKSGFGGLRSQIDDVTGEFADKIRATSDVKEANKLLDQGRKAIAAKLEEAERNVNDQLIRARVLQAERNKPLAQDEYGIITPEAQLQSQLEPPVDQTQQIEKLTSVLRTLKEVGRSAQDQIQNVLFNQKKGGLEATGTVKDVSKPFDDKLAELKAKTVAAKAELEAVGLDEVGQALAKGFGQAQVAIEQVNRANAAKGLKPLDSDQRLQLVLAEQAYQLDEKRAAATRRLREESEGYQNTITSGTEAQKITLDHLQQEIDLTKKLTVAQSYQATFEARVALQLAGETDPLVAKRKKTLLQEQESTRVTDTVRDINSEITATKALTTAQNEGRQAQRAAQLAAIGLRGQAQGLSPEIIKAQQDALKATFDLEDAQNLKGLGVRAGIKAYFQDFRDNTVSTAKGVHDILGGAFEGLDQQITGLLTGQKASFSSFLTGIAGDVAQLELHSLEKNLIGAFSGGSGPASLDVFGGITATAAKSTSSGVLNSIGGFFGKLFSGFGYASGGEPPVGQASVVGEKGPELFIPKEAGTIVPNSKLGGGNVYYSIDARGADAAAVEQRTRRALIAVHGSAVQKAVAASQELSKRRP